MPHKTSFSRILFSSLFFAVVAYFLYSSSHYFLADNTDNTEILNISKTEEKEFFNALTEKNFEYFNTLADNTIESILKPFQHIMDISVIHKNQYLFFSLLGLKENSSLLHNIYGAYNKNKSEITMFPNLAVSIENFNKEALTITLKNTSDTILPIKKSLLLMPQNIKINANTDTILLPSETQKFFITQFIDSIDSVTEIESVEYGYKAKVK